MKNKIITMVNMLMLIFPWTILPLRTFDWALKSPVAEVMITCYAVLMILGGIFTNVSYFKMKVRGICMSICLGVNNLYAVVGVVVLGLIFL